MVLRMRNFNIMGVHWKIQFLGGVKKAVYREEFPKKWELGQFVDLRRAWQKRGGWSWRRFANPTILYLMHSERWSPIVRHCISSTLLDFYFDQESWSIPKILRNLKLLFFSVDHSIVNAKLVISDVISDVFIEIDMHT